MEHKSVLLQETIAGLDIKDGDIIVDMTLGGAGHAFAATQTGANNLTVIGIDADSDAGDRATAKFAGSPARFIFANVYFDKLNEVLSAQNIANVNKVIFDLGYSSFEIDNPERGFSFQHDGPLAMTYSQKPGPHELTAYDVVNGFEEENLADIIYGFGEETFSRRIAAAIVEARTKAPIKTSVELAKIIYEAVPFFYRKGKTHPATKTFQAIRIAVNNELERLKTALHDSFEKLASKGRIAVITFHSLEDRIVKNYFRELAGNDKAKLVNKKPIIPTDEEIKENRRSRSAKLRIIEKI